MFYKGRPQSKFFRRFVTLYLFGAFIGVAFLLGWYVGAEHPKSTTPPRSAGGEVTQRDATASYLLQNVNFNLFWDVWDLVKNKSIDQPVLDTQLFYGSLSGIVAALGDPYSVFFDPETTKKFTDELSGTFEGIGAEIGIKRDTLVIIAPLPETPAERAGLKAGDKILKIDTKDTSGMPLDVAVGNIRGQKGTSVILKIVRNGSKDPQDISIIRDTINVQSVASKELRDNLAYIRIAYFNERTPALFEEAIQAVLAKNPKGLVLDLRNNPGGFLEVAVAVASEWVRPSEVIVFQEFQGGKRDAFRSQGQARLRDMPTIVLVNQGSASASEIVAGALRDHKAARLVGEKTFGKGSVQTFERLSGGSSVKLTIAHWLTPEGHQINGEGIAPDMEITIDKDANENDKDPQLEKAIELLSQKPQ